MNKGSQRSADAILIAGGYGVVGRRIAAKLAPNYPGRVIVAGRARENAEATAGALGNGVRARVLDVSEPASIEAGLDGVAVTVSCIDQPGRDLLHAVVERGLAYTDITPHLTELGRGEKYERIDHAARASGACVVLGTGIVPGISNVMTRALADALGGAQTIDTSLLLSASDTTGPASFDYFLDELTMPFTVHVGGADRPARPFSKPRTVEFPDPLGRRRAYLFPFSDQVLYPRTLGAQTVTSRLAMDPEWLGGALSLLVSSHAIAIFKRRSFRRLLVRARSRRGSRADAPFALRVEVGYAGRMRAATLVAGVQANAAAAGAASVVRALADGEISEPGAWMPEQVIDSARFFSELARDGFEIK